MTKTETRDFIIDHTDGEVTIAPKAGARVTLDPDASRALAHIIAEHADAADRRRRPEAIREREGHRSVSSAPEEIA